MSCQSQIRPVFCPSFIFNRANDDINPLDVTVAKASEINQQVSGLFMAWRYTSNVEIQEGTLLESLTMTSRSLSWPNNLSVPFLVGEVQ